MDTKALLKQCFAGGSHIVIVVPRKTRQPIIRLLPRAGPYGIVIGVEECGGTAAKFRTDRIIEWIQVMDQPAYVKRKAKREKRN